MSSDEVDNRSPRIQLQNVGKIFQSDTSISVVALQEISLDIYPGELVSVIGPSGSGKTTLLHLVAGILACSSGEIQVDKKPVQGPDSSRTIIFQEHNLFPWKTVMQNVSFGLRAQRLPRKEQESVAQRYIELVQLTGFEQAFPYQLSGGMRQRVAIARALAVEPACILMDEPFAALDAQLRGRMQDELLKIAVQSEMTILFVTHDVEEALYLSNRVVVLSPRPGRIRLIQSVDLPWPRQPGERLTADFLEQKTLLLKEMLN